MLQALGASTVGQPAIQLRILLAEAAVGGLCDGREIERRALGPRGGDSRLDDPAGHRARPPPARILSRFAELARNRSVTRRPALPGLGRYSDCRWTDRWDIAEGLVGHAGDAGRSQPASYVLVRRRTAGRCSTLSCGPAGSHHRRSPCIQEFMARRIGAIGTPESMALLVDELGRAATPRALFAIDRDRRVVARAGGRLRCPRRGRMSSQS